MYEFSYAAFDIAAFFQDVGMVNLPMANLLIFLWGLKDEQMRLTCYAQKFAGDIRIYQLADRQDSLILYNV